MNGRTLAANPFKAALAAGRVQIGLWQSLASPVTAEICAAAGFDWLLFDGEHAPNDIPLLTAQLRAIAPFASHAVGRVPIGEVHLIKQYLDIGFQTVLVPLVESAEQAALMVRACRYPPHGIRGVGSALARASGYNRVGDYLARADDEICVLVQVETPAGIEALDAIAATPGVDGVFIGPADLAAALGHRGNPGAAPVQDAIADAAARIARAGRPAGILASEDTLIERYLALGFRFVAVGSDVGLMVRGADQLAARYAGAAGGTTGDGSY